MRKLERTVSPRQSNRRTYFTGHEFMYRMKSFVRDFSRELPGASRKGTQRAALSFLSSVPPPLSAGRLCCFVCDATCQSSNVFWNRLVRKKGEVLRSRFHTIDCVPRDHQRSAVLKSESFIPTDEHIDKEENVTVLLSFQ